MKTIIAGSTVKIRDLFPNEEMFSEITFLPMENDFTGIECEWMEGHRRCCEPSPIVLRTIYGNTVIPGGRVCCGHAFHIPEILSRRNMNYSDLRVHLYAGLTVDSVVSGARFQTIWTVELAVKKEG